MKRTQIGKQPPRYSFLLNPFSDIRLSKCLTCDRPTHPRKFALFIHIEGWGPIALGKTCRYCTHCELIIAHKNELNAEINQGMSQRAPEAIANRYVVIGIVDRKVWRQGLEGDEPSSDDALEAVADFKKVLKLKVERGGWVRSESE